MSAHHPEVTLTIVELDGKVRRRSEPMAREDFGLVQLEERRAGAVVAVAVAIAGVKICEDKIGRVWRGMVEDGDKGRACCGQSSSEDDATERGKDSCARDSHRVSRASRSAMGDPKQGGGAAKL
jgi:hypothetical protein